MVNLKGRSLKRALETKDSGRLLDDIPLITDTTELVTVEKAQKLLKKNHNNRPINWNKVGEYSDLMAKGEWKFHAQGIILDKKGNILTGQKRLWAVIYSGVPQHMRISKGSPPETADFIDRGTSQSSRDLASRKTERKHSPMEQSIARGIFAAQGNVDKPSADEIAKILIEKADVLHAAIKNTRRIKKTKSRYMILAAICAETVAMDIRILAFGMLQELSEKLDMLLLPVSADKCWNRGAAFVLAMEKATQFIRDEFGK